MDDTRFGDGESTPVTPGPAPESPRRRTAWNTLGGRVISLVSRKGGVGKTTSAVNLGAALALSGHSVLVVGVDPQCGVCRSLGSKPHELPVCLSDIFTAGIHLTDLVQASPLADLFFVSPRILTLAQEEDFLRAMDKRSIDFVREIERARNLYDTVLIDCPPSLGPATQAALLASDSYLVPVQTEELCRDSLDSLLDFVNTFRDRNFVAESGSGRSATDPLTLEGMFLTMDNPHTRMGRHVAARVQEEFGGFLFANGIPRTVRLAEMALRGKPAVIYDRRSAGSRAYFDLADELVSRYSLSGAQPDAPAANREQGNGTSGRSGGLPPGGLEKLLSELGGFGAGNPEDPEHAVRPQKAPDHVPPETFDGVEMVSLDDLLDEEESRSGREDWDDNGWMSDTNPDRLN